MPRKAMFYIGLSLLTLGLSITIVPVVLAQPALVEASPAPDAVLNGQPDQITLVFDRALADHGTSIVLIGPGDSNVQAGPARINPTNRFEVSLPLPPIVSGVYTVRYTAMGLGDSTMTVGEYTFNLELPTARLDLLAPVDGQAIQQDSVELTMQIEFFDFNQFDGRIRVYVNGTLDAEVRALDYTIQGLEPGVHEIRTVLARFKDEELPDTETVVYIAVAQRDEEIIGREMAAAAQPNPGLQLTPGQTIAVIALTAALLVLGAWLGREQVSDEGQQNDPDQPPSVDD